MDEIIAQYRAIPTLSVVSQSLLEPAKKSELHHNKSHLVLLQLVPRPEHAALVAITIQPVTSSEWSGCVFFGVAIRDIHCCCNDLGIFEAVLQQAGSYISRVYPQVTVDLRKAVGRTRWFQLPKSCPVPLQFFLGTTLEDQELKIAKGYADTFKQKIKSGIKEIKELLQQELPLIEPENSSNSVGNRKQIDEKTAYDTIVNSFLEDAHRHQKASTLLAWCATLSAGALDCIAGSLPARPVKSSEVDTRTGFGAPQRKRRQRRRDLARVVNAIVYRLPGHPRLIYIALGVKNYQFTRRHVLSGAQLDSIVSWVVGGLEDEDLTILDQSPDIYSPVRAIGERTKLSDEEISKALFADISTKIFQRPGRKESEDEDLHRSSQSADTNMTNSSTTVTSSHQNEASEEEVTGETTIGSIPSGSQSEPHDLIDAAALRNQMFFSYRPRVSHSPSPPDDLRVPEMLFQNIQMYFETFMMLDDQGAPVAPNGVQYQLCSDFDSHCFTFTMLMRKGLHLDAHRALSHACALVRQILHDEHPRTLSCFLEVLIHLAQVGLRTVTLSLRSLIQKMSEQVTNTGHPWREIFRLLEKVDSQSFSQVMARSWACICDMLDRRLGNLSRFAIAVRLDYIKRTYGVENPLEEERLLQELLNQFGSTFGLSTPRLMLNLAHNFNKQRRWDEAENIAQGVLSVLQEKEKYKGRVVERIESLKIISHSQFGRQEVPKAELTMREAIQTIVDQWGRQHPWFTEFMNVLEYWLRCWGRKEEANELRREMNALTG